MDIFNRINSITFLLVLGFLVIIADISILLDIPIYRQVFGFLLVTSIPGLLIIYILNPRFTNPSKIVLYSVGLSVALTMFLGFLVNIIGPMLFGIDRPISTIPLLMAINIVILILFIASLIVNPLGYKSPFDLRESVALFFSPQGLFLSFILLLGIVGGIEVRYYIRSLFSVTAMILIAVTALLIAFDKFFEEKHYTSVLFVIGLILLLTRTLTSPYLGGVRYPYRVNFFRNLQK